MCVSLRSGCRWRGAQSDRDSRVGRTPTGGLRWPPRGQGEGQSERSVRALGAPASRRRFVAAVFAGPFAGPGVAFVAEYARRPVAVAVPVAGCVAVLARRFARLYAAASLRRWKAEKEWACSPFGTE